MMLAKDLNLRLKPGFERRKVTVTVELVTPQFGGGAESRKPDAEQWLRPASVRGALRFWWRALFGASFQSLKDMHGAETAIFGGAAAGNARGQAGKVAVVVQPLNKAQLLSWADRQQRDVDRVKQEQKAFRPVIASAQSVAYFPANENKKERLAAAELVSPSVRAELTIYDLSAFGPQEHQLSDTQWKQLLEALRGFILFGGSGSRTRRGAGAICLSSPHDAQILDMPMTPDALKRWISQYTKPGQEHDCFLLSRCQAIYITPEYDHGEQAQETLLQMWREFRQQRRHPKSWFGRDKWGRTSWPEADAVRLIANQYASWENGGQPIRHQPNLLNKGRAPRAHLGLPIIVKFKDDAGARQTEEAQGTFRRGRWLDTEPPASEIVAMKNGPDGTQQPVDRYASPVLLSVTSVVVPGQPNHLRFVGLVLITRSILKTNQAVCLKGRGDQVLHPGEWVDVVDSEREPRGLRQLLAQFKFQPILTIEGSTK